MEFFRRCVPYRVESHQRPAPKGHGTRFAEGPAANQACSMLPPRTILVATDFSDASWEAFNFAVKLATTCHATLDVLHVEDPLLLEEAGQSGRDLIAEAKTELQRFVDTSAEAVALMPRLHVVSGSVPEAIVTIGMREQAGLIILASHGRSAVTRRPLGSVAHQVLLRADRPVLLVPDHWRLPQDDDQAQLGPVVVGIDRSEPSLAAARAACGLAAALGTTVELLHVVPQSPVPARWKGLADQVVSRRIETANADLRGRCASLTAPAEVRIVTGEVADQLAAAAAPARSRRPVLVIGRAGAQTPGVLPGSIAERVATVAQSPILLYVKPPD